MGQADARILDDELGGDVKMGNLVSLGNYEFYARLLDDGRAQGALPREDLAADPGTSTGRRDAVVRRSRERYGRPREEVEREDRAVVWWLGLPPSGSGGRPLT